MRRAKVVSAALAILWLAAAASEPGSDVASTLKSAIEDFEFGEHAKAADKLSGLLDPIQLQNAEDVIVARQYLGACYYLLEQRPRAEAEFSKILALDPEHKLDPQVFSPALVQFFEDVRARTGMSLRKPSDPPPPDSGPAPGIVTSAPNHNPPFGLAFIPFGVGQFNNRQPVRGAGFAIAEAALFGTALTTFLMFKSLDYRLGPRDEVQFTDPEQASRARTYQSIYLATFYIGLTVAAVGIVEALLSYPGDQRTEPTANDHAPLGLEF